MDALAARQEHVAIEIPGGRPQLRYFGLADQWMPRADVVRGVVPLDGPDGEAVIEVDDHELSLQELGRMLTTHACPTRGPSWIMPRTKAR